MIRRLCDAVAIQSAKWAYITPLMVLVWGRLRRISRRFASLVARMEAGHLKPPRSAVQKPDPGETRPPRPPPPQPPFPSSPGWLLHYVRLEAAATRSLLRHMLEHDPDMRALLEAAPRLGRILRPLWRMVSRDPLPIRLQRPPITRRDTAPPGPPSSDPMPAAGRGPSPPGLEPKPA